MNKTIKKDRDLTAVNLSKAELQTMYNLVDDLLESDIIPYEEADYALHLRDKLYEAIKAVTPVYWINVYIKNRHISGQECIQSVPYSDPSHAADEYVYYLDNFVDPSLYQEDGMFSVADFKHSSTDDPYQRWVSITEDEEDPYGMYCTIALEMFPGLSTRTDWSEAEAYV